MEVLFFFIAGDGTKVGLDRKDQATTVYDRQRVKFA
jgi:hypothetical protein